MQVMCLQDNKLRARNGQKGVMKMTKVNSMGKRLGAAVMACAMAMAMAVSAGAVDVGVLYSPNLVTNAPHPIDIFAGAAEAVSATEIQIPLQEMTVSMGDAPVTGTVEDAVSLTDGYTAYVEEREVDLDNDGIAEAMPCLVVETDEDVPANEFEVDMTFGISVMGHTSNATGTLTLS